jgi:predicted dehydrogenase
MGNADAVQFRNTGRTQILAVCDVDRPQREQRCKEYERWYADEARAGQFKGVAAYNDFRELLAREDIDAVLVATPDHWHALPAIAAARAGKDIYGEKPLSLTIREARAMVDAVRENNRVFQTGSQQRSDARFRRACELVRNGFLGKIQSVYVRVGGPSRPCDLPDQPVPEGLDWNRWLGPAPERGFHSQIHPRTWRAWREYSGGGVTDWGAHHFDIVQWALGMDDSGPVEVIPPDDKDHPLLGLRYANGTMVYHVWGPGANKVPWPSPPQGSNNGITFVGENGWVEVDRQHLRCEPEDLLNELVEDLPQPLQRSPGHHRNFLDCVQSRSRPICDVEIGARSVTVCHLANIAYWTKQSFGWDPVKEEILGNAEAAQWLDRERRAPWTI